MRARFGDDDVGVQFAEAVAFLGGRYPVTAQADAATTVLEIPRPGWC
ncbi:MAG: hypothetical protein M0Z43_13265 [Acidithiobacillus sp.]|nr:hypothetical protein [Acidithiobacillus sp.]